MGSRLGMSLVSNLHKHLCYLRPPPPKKSIFVKKMKIEINAWEDSPSSALSETLFLLEIRILMERMGILMTFIML